MQSLLRGLPAASGGRAHRALVRSLSSAHPTPAGSAPHAASAAVSASSSPAPSVAAAPDAPADPSFLARVIAPGRSTPMFRLLNPELFVEQTKKVSLSGWLVTGMVGFVVVTIGYTQWEYSQTTARVETDARTRKAAAREARKEVIRRELDAEEGPIAPAPAASAMRR